MQNQASLPLDNYRFRLTNDRAVVALTLLPTAVLGISYLSGGVPRLTDLGFLSLTLIMLALLWKEIAAFSDQFGVGGLLFYGGVLIWFCADYMANWSWHGDVNVGGYSAEILAKSAFYHAVFVSCMAVGFLIPKGRWVERTIRLVPEPNSREAYFWIGTLLFIFGLIPYLVWAREPLLEAMTRDFMGKHVSWTGQRTGAFNTRWSGYQTQLKELGQFSTILAMYYAILLSRSRPRQVLCICMWIYWVVVRYHDGRRGPVVFLVMPVVALMFLKYEALANLMGRHLRRKSFTYAGVLGLAGLMVVLIQGQFRATHKDMFAVDLTELEVTKMRGNNMYTATLPAFERIPDGVPYFKNTWPGAGLVRPIPDKVFQLIVGPIPRALWRNKPIDDAWDWYNKHLTGRGYGATTVSPGAVGEWYMNYGIFGVIQGGILLGWLIVVTERTIQNARGRTMTILFALAFMTFLFRSYRDLWVHNLYPIIIGGVAIKFMVMIFWPQREGGSQLSQPINTGG